MPKVLLLLYRGASFPKKQKKDGELEQFSKEQFCKNTVYLERGMPYFAFMDTNAVFVKKIDKS